MKTLRALIIDDEKLARDLIKNYLSSESQVEVVGESEDGFDGFKQINELKPDLVFLDVMMPKLTGFEMLELLESPPAIIFSTAYNEFAIKAFEQNAVDYLLKPYTKERLLDALEKARQFLISKPGNSTVDEEFQYPEALTRVAVRNGSKIHIIGLDQIKYIQAFDDYVKIHTENGFFMKQQTMKFFETNLPVSEFIRVHRSYILNVRQISKLEPMGKDTHVAVLIEGTEIPVSRSGYSKLKDFLKF